MGEMRVLLTLGSLFDGISAFPEAAQRNGIETVWASEIEPFPISVSKKHFPGMKHLGDIREVHGGAIEPVDIITFGSPCQDLSVAGKRTGLGGTRSRHIELNLPYAERESKGFFNAYTAILALLHEAREIESEASHNAR